MKTKYNSYRGAGFSPVRIAGLAAVIALFAALLLPQEAQADYVDSYYINTTNLVSVAGTNYSANAIIGVWTNNFNLSVTSGSQTSTNLWPAVCLQKQNNIFTPSRWVTHQLQFNALAANSSAIVWRFAGSTSGKNWQTNPCPLIITATANGTAFVQNFTNLDTGGCQYYSLMTEENPGAGAITNIYHGDGYNRGL
jgi:hypothetical protein